MGYQIQNSSSVMPNSTYSYKTWWKNYPWHFFSWGPILLQSLENIKGVVSPGYLRYEALRIAYCKLSWWPGTKRRRQSENGQTIVEMAFVLLPLLLLIFAIFDFSILFYVYQSMEHGVSEATRYGITGQQMPDPDNPVITTSLSRGISTLISFRLCSRAPVTRITSDIVDLLYAS